MLPSNFVQQCELPTPHGASTDVPDFPQLNEVMKSPHSFFGVGLVVIAVDLEKVDIAGLQPL